MSGFCVYFSIVLLVTNIGRSTQIRRHLPVLRIDEAQCGEFRQCSR
jgi:hypothetical protein